MVKITLTLNQLDDLLNQQKSETAKYITRNLSVYSFYSHLDLSKVNIDFIKHEIEIQCNKSPMPNDLNILKKYLNNHE